MSDAQPTSAGSFNDAIIEEFRENAGQVGGMFAGAPLVLLTTTGAKSGRRHTTPAVYFRDGDRILVFGSNAGADTHPAWFHNLRANPEVTVEIGRDGAVETYQASAVVLEGEERDRHYAEQVERDPAFAAYQAGTTRIIPVVALGRHRRSSIGRRGVLLGAVVTATVAAGVSAAVIESGSSAPKSPAAQRVSAIGDHLRNVHGQLRRDLAAVRAEFDAYLDAPGATAMPSLPNELRGHCVAFCGALHEHHTNEDGVFPALARQHPELAPVVERLQREHGVVARVLSELQGLLDRGDARDAARLRAEFGRLAGDLETHFAYEEDTLVETLNATDPATLRR
ncbi:nitroreductase/quinone reductase family protein [Nocardia sp. GCM10030253]|uniref:nitroreductase/quinone reductase family protein n=1 Tax=Nocardia sp. GCM10030253 TaxID=3273404 RepID=UPI00362F7BD8